MPLTVPVKVGEASGALLATAVVKADAADSSKANWASIEAKVAKAAGAAPTTAWMAVLTSFIVTAPKLPGVMVTSPEPKRLLPLMVTMLVPDTKAGCRAFN